MTDPRHWSDRHGPLAFSIVGCVTAISLLGVALQPEAVAVVVPAVAASLAAMHGAREWARQKRVKVANGDGNGVIPHEGKVS